MIDWAALADLPVHGLDGAELDDLELVLTGGAAGSAWRSTCRRSCGPPPKARPAAFTDPRELRSRGSTQAGLAALRPAAPGAGGHWRRARRRRVIRRARRWQWRSGRSRPGRTSSAAVELRARTGTDRLLLVALVGHGTPMGGLRAGRPGPVRWSPRPSPLEGAETLVVPLTPGPDRRLGLDAWTPSLAAYVRRRPRWWTRPRAERPEEAARLRAVASGGRTTTCCRPPRLVACAHRSRPAPRAGPSCCSAGCPASGKSTIARALADRDRGLRRTAGVAAGRRRGAPAAVGGARLRPRVRELNVRRIGYVAALVAEHGGLAVCAPIAPFAAARADCGLGQRPVGGFVAGAHRDAARGVRGGATARASTPRRARGRSPSSPGSATRTRRPPTPTWSSTPPTRPCDEAVEAIWAELVRRGLLT